MADLKISELTDYTPAVDADILPIVDTTLSTTKKISWANIKATLKTYFDGIYTTSAGATPALDNLASVAINTTLVSDTDNTDALGTAAIAWSDLFLGNESVITWSSAPNTSDITLTHSANLLTLSGGSLTINGDVTATAATITASTIQANTAITTDSVDGAPIGDATHSFSDLFLASGAVINFDNSNATLTHSAGLLTSNVPLSLGTSNALTCGTIELGHASDTTLARVSAGVMSVEGARVITSTGTTSGTILKNNGTTFVASTETYAAPGTSGNVMTSDGTNWTSAAPAASAAFWTAVTGTRASNTTFTVGSDVTAIFKKGLVIKWTESGTIRNAMVSIPSTYSSPNTTVTIVGDTMASIDANSLKYAMIGAENFIARFAYAGTLGATGTDIANAYYATEPMRVLAMDLQHGTAGVTTTFVMDCNKNGTTMFTTKPSLATTVASSPTPFTADSATSLALGDRVSIDIDTINTGTLAIDLYAQLYLFPTRLNYLT